MLLDVVAADNNDDSSCIKFLIISNNKHYDNMRDMRQVYDRSLWQIGFKISYY